METKQLIQTKISENEKIITQLTADLDKISIDRNTIQNTPENEKKIKFSIIQLVILKDKILFHKGIVQGLKDLEQEISKV